MKILALGDIHYPREAKIFADFLSVVEKEKPNMILLCGDIINYANLFYLEKFLSKLRKRVPKTEIVGVMGNHDFWLTKKHKKLRLSSWDLLESYRRTFRRYGAYLLWREPYYSDSFTIVGVPGWYDFTFAPFELGFTRRDFLRGYYEGYQWMDMMYTDFRMTPEEITSRNADMLKRQLERVKNPIIVLLHFVPLKDFLLYTGNPENDFWNAYGGSKVFGEIILSSNKNIKYVFFGHVDYKRLKTIELKLEGIIFRNVDISEGIQTLKILHI